MSDLAAAMLKLLVNASDVPQAHLLIQAYQQEVASGDLNLDVSENENEDDDEE